MTDRHYGPDNLGGRCAVCGELMPAALPDNVHPTCDPEHHDNELAYARATRTPDA